MATVFCLAGAFGQPQQVDQMLGGSVCEGNTVVNLNYFNDFITQVCVTDGAAALNNALTRCSDEAIVLAHSLGSVCCCYWLANYGPCSRVRPEKVCFILLGNSVRPYGGYCYYLNWFHDVTVPTDTPFTVTDFSRQYDGWADYPPAAPGDAVEIISGTYDAIVNAYAGQGSVHPNYVCASLTDPNNVSYSVGNITYMWEMTFPVPMVGSMNAAGHYVDGIGLQVPPSSFNAQDEWLRPVIEKAYRRPVIIPPPNYAIV
jgi:diacyltrehalose acyltransferase